MELVNAEINNLLDHVEHCWLGNTISLVDEEAYNELIDLLDDASIPHRRNENTYAGIFMVELFKK